MKKDFSLVDIGEIDQSVRWQSFPAYVAEPALTVVRVSVERFGPYLPSLATCLSEEERARSCRFARPTDTARFIIARGMLRCLLARFTDQKPEEIAFESGTGKPKLITSGGPAFNVSHSGDWIVYAFDAAPVGIDVEQINSRLDHADIVHYHFTPDEQQFVWHHGFEGFYTLWTRKEALLKAIGRGVDDNLTAAPALAGLHQVKTEPGEEVHNWVVRTFPCSDHYPAALAYQNRGKTQPHITFYEVKERLDF